MGPFKKGQKLRIKNKTNLNMKSNLLLKASIASFAVQSAVALMLDAKVDSQRELAEITCHPDTKLAETTEECLKK
jgi:hypothetical protein